jgi:PHS family inorganic phosphate transporter-like MFS transporter
LITIITLASFKSDLKAGNVHDADKIWRILVGLSLVPAFGTLYARLTLPESRKFELTKAQTDSSVDQREANPSDIEKAKDADSDASPKVKPVDQEDDLKHHVVAVERAHYQEFIAYFSTWPHLKVLLGTTSTWFLVDIAFYGINVRSHSRSHEPPLTLH